jgi:flagellar export protein FliJ
MRKFVFKFAAILKLREQRQEEAFRALAAAQRAYQMELARKSKLEQDLRDSLDRREKHGSLGAIDISVFHLEEKFIIGTKQRIAQAEHAIFRARKNVERALRGFLLARRQTRIMEVLREEAFAEFKRSMVKKELREMDELSIMRARFRREIA